MDESDNFNFNNNNNHDNDNDSKVVVNMQVGAGTLAEGNEYLKALPVGFRFVPTDVELIVEYLEKKVKNEPLCQSCIYNENIYLYSPDQLAAKYEFIREKQWYFFTPRDKKYPRGARPARAANGGYWKPTGRESPIEIDGKTKAYKRTLDFYAGNPREGTRTNWKMHEYRMAEGYGPNKRDRDDMKLDDCLLCKIYQLKDKNNKDDHPGNNRDAVAGANNINGNPDHHHQQQQLEMDHYAMQPGEGYVPDANQVHPTSSYNQFDLFQEPTIGYVPNSQIDADSLLNYGPSYCNDQAVAGAAATGNNNINAAELPSTSHLAEPRDETRFVAPEAPAARIDEATSRANTVPEVDLLEFLHSLPSLPENNFFIW